MLDLESVSVWERLKKAKNPILLYGMGNGADKILSAFEQYGICCSGVFASDGFVRGHTFHGFSVLSYSEACHRFGNFVIVLAFAVFRREMLEWIAALSEKHELYAPDVPVVGEELFTPEYLYKHYGKIQKVYDFLPDKQSKLVYRNVLNFKISGKVEYLKKCETESEKIYQELFVLQDRERYLDLGAYNGDTIREFIRYAPGYEQIIALEPDEKNFKKLICFLEQQNIPRAKAYQYVAWSQREMLSFAGRAGRNSAVSNAGTETVQAESIDHVLSGEPVTFIKMDVEGAEQEALLGGAKTLRQYAPKLKIAAYHRSGDMFELPLLIKKINPEYEIYFRHHPYIPAWETNLYCKVC